MTFVRVLFTTAALAIGLLPLMPAEHVHEQRDHDGHVHRLAHRHTSHHADFWAAKGPILDEQEPLLTLDTFFAPPPRPFMPPLVLTSVPLMPEPELSDRRLRDLISHPIHGPPLSTPALRGPPA